MLRGTLGETGVRMAPWPGGTRPQGPSLGCPRRLPPPASACITFYFEHHCKHPPNKCRWPSDTLVVLGEKEQCKILSVGCPQLSTYAQEKTSGSKHIHYFFQGSSPVDFFLLLFQYLLNYLK